MSEGSGNKRGFFEKVTFEPMSDRPVGADQVDVGRGRRKREIAFLVKKAELSKGEAKQMEDMVLERAWAFDH